MQQTRDRDDEALDVDAAFADPAFAVSKARNVPLAILRLGGRAGEDEALWANAAAAAHWRADTAAALARALFGVGRVEGTQGTGASDGWLDGLLRGLVPGRTPRLMRSGLGRGFRMRARTALVRAWADRDGATLVGLAVPDAAPDPAAGADGVHPDGDAWRRPAWPPAASPDASPVAEPEHSSTDGPAADGTRTAPAADDDPLDGSPAEGPAGDGAALARRGQLAVLRDRLGRALDGATTLRLLWRTDAAGAVAGMDARVLARLASPLRFEASGPGFDAVAPFDPDGAGRLRAALAGRATFAGIAFDLPVADGAASVPMVLSGSPTFGPDRAFAGFRGFGTVDLGNLALAERPTPAVPPAASPNADPQGAVDRRETADGGHPDAASGPVEVREPSEAPDESKTSFEAPVEPDPGIGPALAPAPALEPAPEARPPANVVQLRAFQDLAPGRFAAGPAPGAEAAARPAGEDGDGRPASPPDEGTSAREDAPLSDQLAFLALGEALRARIGAPPRFAETPEPVKPTEAVSAVEPTGQRPAAEALDEPASALLDRLPIAVLATVRGRPVFANPAAAARLGHHDAGALLAAADAVEATAEPGVVRLKGAGGEAVTVAARRAEVPWAGSSATLWLLDLPAEPTAAAGAAPDAAEAGVAGGEDGRDSSVELLDRVDDAVALLDAAGRLRRLNGRGEGWFGRRDAAEPGRSLADLLAPESRAAAFALLGEVRDQRGGLGTPPLRRDVVARTAAGADVPMLLTLGRLGAPGAAASTASGGAPGFYATLRDASSPPAPQMWQAPRPPRLGEADGGDQARAERDQAGAERDQTRAAGTLADLLARVSHEIRTPLGSILGFAEVMMDERFGPLGNPRYKDYLKDIHASGAQVVALVDDLLDLSRIEAGHLDLDIAAVDINRVVTEAVAQMQPEAHRERVIMRTSLAGRIPSVLVDERSAQQIVRNLLSNAVRFNEPGGQVIVSTAPGEGEGVLLRVRDTGVGMSEEAIAAALEPLGGLPSRLGGSALGGSTLGGTALGSAALRGDAAGRNGLGLPLTRALVGANGASMTIRSRPREGTLVEVSFAAAAEGEARRPA